MIKPLKYLEPLKEVLGVYTFKPDSFFTNRGENWEWYDQNLAIPSFYFTSIGFAQSCFRSCRGYHANSGYKCITNVFGDIFPKNFFIDIVFVNIRYFFSVFQIIRKIFKCGKCQLAIPA